MFSCLCQTPFKVIVEIKVTSSLSSDREQGLSELKKWPSHLLFSNNMMISVLEMVRRNPVYIYRL